METHGHEQLLICHEPSQGLRAFIAIHDTTLGPGCGGLRVWPHASEDDAIMDVLRLSRAMTYKSAVAGLDLGGAKALIMADPRTDKNEAMLARVRAARRLTGRAVRHDRGRRDDPRDLEYIAQETEHVVGLPESLGGSGDTSLMTGLGVYLGMKAAAKATWGDDSLSGRTVAFQGFGHVGSNTASHLLEEGAKIVATDIFESARQSAADMGATVVEPDDIYDTECDIFSPCALGGVLNGDTIPRLRCQDRSGRGEQPTAVRRRRRPARRARDHVRARLRHQRGRDHQRRLRDRWRLSQGQGTGADQAHLSNDAGCDRDRSHRGHHHQRSGRPYRRTSHCRRSRHKDDALGHPRRRLTSGVDTLPYHQARSM